MRVEEEMFERAFGESVEETLREMSEGGVVARARKEEAAPNKKEEGSTIWIAPCLGVGVRTV